MDTNTIVTHHNTTFYFFFTQRGYSPASQLPQFSIVPLKTKSITKLGI